MEKNKIKALCLGLLLSLSTFISPCITSYGTGGDVELCISYGTGGDVELCIEDNENEVSYFLDDEDNEDLWMELLILYALTNEKV